jgi:single-strand DNA-binding protein
MRGINQVVIVGNVGQDAVLRPTQNGSSFITFSLAVGETFVVDGERRERTEWIPVVMWGSRAKALHPMIKKGSRLSITGKLHQRSWTDQNGVTHRSMEVRCNDICLEGRQPEERLEEPPTPSDSEDSFYSDYR